MLAQAEIRLNLIYAMFVEKNLTQRLDHIEQQKLVVNIVKINFDLIVLTTGINL